MHQRSVSWHIIPPNVLVETSCFQQKEPIKVQFFRLLNALMNLHPISHAIFETTSWRFFQILHHCLVSWKITPLQFFNSNLNALDKRAEVKFSNFWMIGWKFTKFLMPCLKLQVFKLYITLSVSIEKPLLYFFSWKCTWFGQKEPIKVQNFRISDFCTSIDSFCWEYTNFSY